MQLLETVRIGVAQAVAEEVGEQQVEAIPLAFAIQRQEEQLHGLQALQQRLAVLAPGQALARSPLNWLATPRASSASCRSPGKRSKTAASR